MSKVVKSGFSDFNKRNIMIGPKGGAFIRVGKYKRYNPIARYVVNKNTGKEREVVASNKLPGKVRMIKTTRKVRKNKGVKRGPRKSLS